MSLTWKKHAVLKPPSDAEIARMTPEALLELHEAYHAAIENAERDPLNCGFMLKPWADADRLMGESTELCVFGGNRCLAGEQEIYDPEIGYYRRVDEIDGDFTVLAYDDLAGRLVRAKALRPFRKHPQKLFRVHLSDGTVFRCSQEHRILAQSKFASVGELSPTSLVYAPRSLNNCDYVDRLLSDSNHPVSIWDIDLSASRQDVDRLIQTLSDWKCRCFAYFHRGDEQPRLVASNGPNATPSPADVLKHAYCVCGGMGDLGNKPQYIRLCLYDVRPSTRDVLIRFAGQFSDILSHSFCRPCKSTWRKCADQEIEQVHLQSAAAFYRQSQSIGEFSQPGIRFYYVLAYSYYTIPVKTYYLRFDDVWDFTVPEYHNYLIGNSVHHNSGKTQYGARAVVKAATENQEAMILCFAQDATASIRVQQKAIFDWLPYELKQTVRSQTGYVKYSLKNGFTGDSLIIPSTRSTIAFHTYSQFLNNPGKFEGLELGSMECGWNNIGLWLDEYLQGPDLVNTLRFRLATRDAKMLITFTPIDGITEFLAGYLNGAETVATDKAELLDNATVPYIQKAQRRDAAIIYFHTKWNPFGGYERLAKDLKDRPRDEILTRAYGVPVSTLTGQFPMFRRAINVMKHADMMSIVRDDKAVTRYMGIDPAPNKRWFIIWMAIDRAGTWYVYREWPDKSYGDWAEMGANNKSRYAEASKPDGKGIRDYVELFEIEENGEKIYERLIDPRMGATPRQVEEGTTTIINQLEDEGCVVLPAPGAKIEAGLALLNGLMSYNADKPIDAANRPSFYISDRCENTIDSLLNYTGAETNEAWGDPIDVLRYLATAEPVFEGNLVNKTRLRGNGGY